MAPISLRIYRRYRQNVSANLSRLPRHRALCGNLPPADQSPIIAFLPLLMAQPPLPIYLALRILKQLVEGTEFPLAVLVLHHQTYVDDLRAFDADDQILAHQTRAQLIVIKERRLSPSKIGEQHHRSIVRVRSRGSWFSHS